MNSAEQLLDLCKRHKITIGTAESCTGGNIAAHITQIPGASDVFVGSIVSYTNAVKVQILGVSPQILEQDGPVSQSVTRAMLEGVLKQLACDCAIAITGIAGPTGGTKTTPIGTIIIATGGKNLKTEIVGLHLRGNRSEIIQKATEAAIHALINRLEI